MNVVDWIVKRLGGYTRADVMSLRSMCASMADEFGKGLSPLVLRGGEYVKDLAVVGSIYIIGDYVNVHGCMFWVGENTTAIHMDGTGTGRVLHSNIITPPFAEITGDVL